jgi:Tannase-like family of unknown function (DUF6351)
MRWAVLAPLATAVVLCWPSGALARRHPADARRSPVIRVLSSRADLITGGQALVSVTLPARAKPRRVRIWLNGHAVEHEFALRPGKLYEGLVTGLELGANELTATLPSGRGATITITNHPIGGPVFSGPQLQPWTCEAGATDAKCDKPTAYSYLYEPRGSNSLQPYNPADPPTNVATTTTDQGVTVPFIVREEIAYEDRDQVRIETLYQPGKPWRPWSPQPQWDHRLYIMHGFDCHDTRGVTPAPWGDAGGLLPSSPATTDSSVVALGMGFVVMSTALDNSAVDCNPALQAESLLMAKEHIVDQYGPIEFTIGYGCSGGSLAEQWVANAYPGIYQGLIPQCSFPDAGSTAQQILDYEALDNYFSAATGANPLSWTPPQESEVDGTAIDNVPSVPQDATFSAQEFFPFALPSNCTDYDAGETYVSASQVYNPQTNPGGVRCGLLDWDINLLGPQRRSVWDAQEKAVGHGFAGIPIDNVGVQYGLSALEKGEISPAQFADLNARIGSFNVDLDAIGRRATANQPALANAYRTGLINEANHLNQVAIIDLTGPNDPGLAHDSFRAFAMRDRIQREFGTSANMVIWEGPVALLGDVDYTGQALVAMDRWLEAVAADHSSRTLPQKLIADKPATIHDQCSDGAGTVVASSLCPSSVVPVYGTPRTVAGEPQSTDQNVCQLVALKRSSYDVTFTDAEWSELEQAFPTGVCDYSKPGVSQQPTVAWLTYQTATGRVIYGGRPLGRPPGSRACRVRSPAHPGRCTAARRH